MTHLLSLVTFFPLLGAALLLLLPRGDKRKLVDLAHGIALATALITFAIAVCVYGSYDAAKGGFQLVEKAAWIPAFGISYHKGVDGISLWFVLLSALLSPIAILSGFAVKERVRSFMVALLVLESMMIGMFTSLDFFLFYIFFEGVLIPMFLIIGVWGGEKRIYAAMKFFLYTFLGSVLMLVAIFAMTIKAGTSDMTAMIGFAFPKELAVWLWLAFFASFAVKTPMWPFHTWLPYAHVEAPTAGSVILAGVLLKMGGYGFIRISLQMLPEASAIFAPYVIALSLIAIVYASLVALAQTDMKKLVAYSSVAHMGYVTLGLFSGRAEGVEGAMMVMLSHGFVAAALFLCVGVVYDRLHTRQIDRYQGLATIMPRYGLVAMIFTLAAIGLPGTSGFVGEFLTMLGAWHVDGFVAAGAALGVILGAAYMLWLYRRVFFGVAEKSELKTMADLNVRELAMFAPLVLLVFWMGIAPGDVRHVFAKDVARIGGIARLAPKAEPQHQAPASGQSEAAPASVKPDENEGQAMPADPSALKGIELEGSSP